MGIINVQDQGQRHRQGVERKPAVGAKNHAEALVHSLDNIRAEHASEVGKEGPSGGRQTQNYVCARSFKV